MSNIAVCVLEGSNDVKGTVHFECMVSVSLVPQALLGENRAWYPFESQKVCKFNLLQKKAKLSP